MYDLVGDVKLCMDVLLCGPKAKWPEGSLVVRCREIKAETGDRLTPTTDMSEGVKGADYLYTDV